MAETNYNRLVAQIVGAVLVLVGLLGFVLVPSGDGLLLGLFGVNLLHNLVHLLSGAILLGAAFMQGGRNARLTNMILGAVYIVVAVATWIGPLADLFNLDMMDAGLHAVIGLVLLGVAFAMKGDAMTARPM